MKRPTQVFTIGYQGRTLTEFLARLTKAGVAKVVDVRELPLSRRKGFSKTALREALLASGIEYVHLRAAGNPYRDQKADIATCLRLYRKHLERTPEVVEQVADELKGSRAALLCFEECADQCHRSVIVGALEARGPVSVQHL